MGHVPDTISGSSEHTHLCGLYCESGATLGGGRERGGEGGREGGGEGGRGEMERWREREREVECGRQRLAEGVITESDAFDKCTTHNILECNLHSVLRTRYSLAQLHSQLVHEHVRHTTYPL